MKMYEKLRARVEGIFESAPKTRRANDLKEELMANLIDRYNDLIAAGKSEDEAVNGAIDGIGDIDELIRGLKETDVFDYQRAQNQQKKSALIISSAVGMYILSVVILILFHEVLMMSDGISVCIMLLIDAAATCLLIYNGIARPRYRKADDTVVEEFKEWKSKSSRNNTLIQSVKSLLWTITVAVYLIISFMFGAWGYSWIIFIIAAAVQKVIVLYFQLKE